MVGSGSVRQLLRSHTTLLVPVELGVQQIGIKRSSDRRDVRNAAAVFGVGVDSIIGLERPLSDRAPRNALPK